MSEAFEYDLAVSFAQADKAVAEELSRLLNQRDINVFLDEYKSPEAWGNILDHLVNLYARKARYCVLLVSKHYPLGAWTEAERTSARESALRDPEEYILPLRLDHTEVAGVEEVQGYRDLREHPIESIASWLEARLNESQTPTGPPSESHDLRSGNVSTG